jgi:hypothetical protein
MEYTLPEKGWEEFGICSHQRPGSIQSRTALPFPNIDFLLYWTVIENMQFPLL